MNFVRIRGLPFTTCADDIIHFFKGVKIMNGRRGIHFPQGPNGRSNGEAYVELEDEAELDKAMSHHNEHMGRRYIEVFPSSLDEMKYVMGRSVPGSAPKKDYVVRLRGLPYDTEKREIYAFFNGLELAPNGIGLLVDHMGRCTGEAYVQFTSSESLDRAKEKHMEKIGHRYIEIFESTMREANINIQKQMDLNNRRYSHDGYSFPNRDSYHSRGRFDSPRNPPRSYGGPVNPRQHYPSRFTPYGRPQHDYGPTEHESPSRYFTQGRGPIRSYGGDEFDDSSSSTGHSVRMRGLPFSANTDEIHRFIAPLQPVNVRFLQNSTGRPTGEAIVDFASHDEAKEAMKKDREKIGSRYIELFLASTPTGNSVPDRTNGNGPVTRNSNYMHSPSYTNSVDDRPSSPYGMDRNSNGMRFMEDYGSYYSTEAGETCDYGMNPPSRGKSMAAYQDCVPDYRGHRYDNYRW